MHRHEFHGGDAEPLQVFHARAGGKTRIGAAERWRHFGMLAGEPLDVEFVDDRIVPRSARRSVVAPGESGIHHPAFRHIGGAVAFVPDKILTGVAHPVAEEGVAPVEGSPEGFGVWVEKELASD